ncbi:AraC family transcriptional regulator [Mycolicibacterium fortuitum]|uniref:AraC family transcriptional regulator n=1 Tax=Mycolicibacterium fortuitum TaxID=1766 RepID=UPI001F46A925|nr:AraC family transcriptional regulator [Mycolicibacterium fortuitum]
MLVDVVEVAERANLPVEHWLTAAGLGELQLRSPDARVSFRQAADFLRRAVRAMPDRGLGIEVGSRDMYLSFGVLGLAIRSSETLSAAMDIGMELHQTTGSLMDVGVEFLDGVSVLRAHERHPEPAILPFLCEELFCSIVVTMRSALEDARAVPEYLQLSYPAPRYAHRYREFFACPVLFNADGNRLALPQRMLELPLPRRDPATHAVAVAACRNMLDRNEHREDLVFVVETMLRDSLRDPPTMSQVSARLNMTERTLRRRLGTSGERFSDLRDRLRSERAKQLIRETTMPIHQIAAEVGFADPREFRRAYIKWSGYPPTHERTAGHTT